MESGRLTGRVVIFVACLLLLQSAFADPTGRLPSSQRYVSMNDAEQVAFIGTANGCQNIYTFNAATPGALNVLMNPVFELPYQPDLSAPTMAFTAPMINNSGNVVAWRYLAAIIQYGLGTGIDAPIPDTYIEEWPFAGTSQPLDLPIQLVASGNAGEGDASSLFFWLNPAWGDDYPSPYVPYPGWYLVRGAPSDSAFPAHNASGLVAYCGQIGNNFYLTTTDASAPDGSLLLNGALPRPRLSDSGLIVASIDNGSARTLTLFTDPSDLNTSTVIAGPGIGFTSIGICPAINKSGSIIAFSGDYEGSTSNLTTGPGIFAAINNGGNWSVVRVANTPDNAYVDSNVGVNNSGQVIFKANNLSNNATLFAVTINSPANASIPVPLASINGIAASGKITDLEFYDGLPDSGNVAYWVRTDMPRIIVQPVPQNGPITSLRVPLPLANIHDTDNIDASIVPVTDTGSLAGATNRIIAGVVADGVTPVLFRITNAPGIYSLSISNDSGNINNSFYTNLFVLQLGAWVNSTNLVISGSNGAGTNYAYLQGLDWGQFFTVSPYHRVRVTLRLFASSSTNSSSATFEVRPPPIALVHGYNANSSSWGSSFLTNLFNFMPSDFVTALNYGTSYENSVNTTASLNVLAPMLDQVLVTQVEARLTDWAYTRYDVVGHSQGGVLTRMLCQNTPDGLGAFISTPVVSPSNYFRGRFRRVITIGSPHNGSVLLHYILQMKHSYQILPHVVSYFLEEKAQPKFDPFGPQIKQINDVHLQVDHRIKFECIQATINSGRPPTDKLLFQPGPDIDCYGSIGLQTPAGAILLPEGSDGIVDFESQGAGFETSTRYISDHDIAHADVTSADGTFQLFGVPPGQSDTTYPEVALNVIALLNGPASEFGPFDLPVLLSDERKAQIDAIIPEVTVADMIFAGASTFLPSSNYVFTVRLPNGVAAGGTLSWQVQVFSTNGVSTDDTSLQKNATNSAVVTVTVTNDVQGTVVLYASYTATNGTLVFANPVVVYSSPVGATLSGIQLQPPSAVLSVGDTLPLDVWGQYTNGASSLLYLGDGQATYVSSAPNVASVDSSGNVTLKSFGSATILASYGGFTATAIVSSVSPTISSFSAAPGTNGIFQLNFMGTPGWTNIIQASTNLIDWFPVAVLFNTNGFIQFQDQSPASFPRRFYRVQIPQIGNTNLFPFVSLSSPSRANNGVFQLTLFGTAGVTNVIQTSTNLTNWTTLTTIPNTNGIIVFTDSAATNASSRFYRALIE